MAKTEFTLVDSVTGSNKIMVEADGQGSFEVSILAKDVDGEQIKGNALFMVLSKQDLTTLAFTLYLAAMEES